MKRNLLSVISLILITALLAGCTMTTREKTHHKKHDRDSSHSEETKETTKESETSYTVLWEDDLELEPATLFSGEISGEDLDEHNFYHRSGSFYEDGWFFFTNDNPISGIWTIYVLEEEYEGDELNIIEEYEPLEVDEGGCYMESDVWLYFHFEPSPDYPSPNAACHFYCEALYA